MSFKNREVQPELFGRFKDKQNEKVFSRGLFSKNFSASINISIDTLIVVVIAGIMVNLTAFVVGIERGKGLAKFSAEYDTHKKQLQDVKMPSRNENFPAVTAQEQKKNSLDKLIEEEKKQAVPQIEPKGGYSIQLASYTSNSFADKEAVRLKERGVKSFVLKKGNYFVVYSGVYASKTSAAEQLSSFKKRYKDCLIRYLENT